MSPIWAGLQAASDADGVRPELDGDWGATDTIG